MPLCNVENLGKAYKGQSRRVFSERYADQCHLTLRPKPKTLALYFRRGRSFVKIYELTPFNPSLHYFGSPSILTRELSPVGFNPCVDPED